MILRKLVLIRERLGGVARSIRAPLWVSRTLIAIALLCALALSWLVLDAAIDKEVSLPGKALLFVIGLLAAAGAVAFSWEPAETPPLKRLATPWGAGLVMVAVFTGFSTMTDALSWFEPRAATTRDTARIEAAVAGVDARISGLERILRARFPENPPILAGIAGRWGEQATAVSPACALVWDIAIIQRGDAAALSAELVVRPDGVPPFRLLADIVAAEDNRMTVIGEEPQSARGSAAEFMLNEATGRLVWDDKASAGGVEEYQRCP